MIIRMLLTVALTMTSGMTICFAQPAVRVLDVRIKDITRVEGDRTNVLTGLGLVTGLKGTGGKNPITREFVLNLTQKFGIRAEPDLIARLRNDTADKSDNTSVVVVTASLGVNMRKGQEMIVNVSTLDDAKDLGGGILLPTPLTAVDGQVYAVGSGPVTTGSFTFGGEAAGGSKNHPTTGTAGATVEKETFQQMRAPGRCRLLLRNADYETAMRIAAAANQKYPASAEVLDAGCVLITAPPARAERTLDFVAEIQQLRVVPDFAAKVVINERTGTIVIGEHVRLSRVLINHANLAIMTAETPEVSQPAPFSNGETTTVPRTQVDVVEERNPLTVLDETTTVADLANALNALGVSPRDLSSIFQHLQVAGALHAEIIRQ